MGLPKATCTTHRSYKLKKSRHAVFQLQNRFATMPAPERCHASVSIFLKQSINSKTPKFASKPRFNTYFTSRIITLFVFLSWGLLVAESMMLPKSSSATEKVTWMAQSSISRRKSIQESITFLTSATAIVYSSPPRIAMADDKLLQKSPVTTIHHPFHYSETWTGTNLPLLSLKESIKVAQPTDMSEDERRLEHSNIRSTTSTATETAATSNLIWPMGRWPDPILRRPAEPVNGDKWFGTDTLSQACLLLQTTADHHGAVGLAAQQCGINARIVYINLQPEVSTNEQQQKTGKDERRLLTIRKQRQQDGSESVSLSTLTSLMMINPRIVQRSPEADMLCWEEQCLVLPPSFTNTLLRDQWVDVQYWTDKGELKETRLKGELARCAQHEMGTRATDKKSWLHVLSLTKQLFSFYCRS